MNKETVIGRMNLKQVQEYVRHMEPSWPALFLWGPPGIGKSQSIAQAASEQKIGLIYYDASMKDPTDIRGILFIVNGKAKYLEPDDLPRIERDGPQGILFLDELLFATPSVQNNLHTLILDRKIGQYRLPNGWKIVAASNREEDRAQIFQMSGPLANRFIHIEVEVDYDIWAEWAFANNIHPDIIAFLKLHPDLLARPPGEQLAYPTPRSWEFVSKILASDKISDEVRHEVIKGTVGAGAAIAFFGFQKIGQQALQLLEQIMQSKFPQQELEPSLQWTINCYLIHRAVRDKNALANIVIPYALHLQSEYAVHLLKNIIANNANNEVLFTHPKWKEFVKKHSYVFARG